MSRKPLKVPKLPLCNSNIFSVPEPFVMLPQPALPNWRKGLAYRRGQSFISAWPADRIIRTLVSSCHCTLPLSNDSRVGEEVLKPRFEGISQPRSLLLGCLHSALAAFTHFASGRQIQQQIVSKELSSLKGHKVVTFSKQCSDWFENDRSIT